MRFDEVFVPNDQPTYTYVDRDNRRLEANLEDYIKTKNIVVSISGPSKTGKTVLFKNAVDENSIIPISGVSIRSEPDLWTAIFSWLGEPIHVSTTTGSNIAVGAQGNVQGKVSAFIAGASATGGGSFSYTRTTTDQKSIPFDPFSQIVKEIGGSDFVIFIDDFHYIHSDIQPQIARIIKAMAENGVKVCTASVPHKNDDVVRANPELRGRLASIDVESWKQEELEVIGKKGFPLLNIDLSPKVVRDLASEAFGSPQLMQALCLNLCRNLSIREKLPELRRIEVGDEIMANTLEDTSNLSNFSSLLTAMHNGPKKHGKDRKIFAFSDETRGDVYRATLLAIASGDPKRDLNYDEIMIRVKGICVGDAPVGSSVQGALTHMSLISSEMSSTPVFEWDEDILALTDPYFVFYLRSSRKIEKLARTDQ
jgi:hypothetical protein